MRWRIMGKPSRRPERDPEPPPAVRERLVAAAEQHAAAARASAEAPAPRPPWTLRSILPESLLLPWWVVLFLSGYALLKLGMGLEHPCGVLGISGSVSRGAISKSYRALSMCTHPDKLRARSEDDMKRGELLFKRASRAREELLASMRAPGPAAPAEAHPSEAGGAGGEGEASAEAAAQATCSTELDAALYRGVVAVVSYLRELGLRHIGLAVGEFLWGVVSFEHGPTYTCSLLLLLLTLLSFAWALVSYLVATGPVTTLLSAAAAAAIGPLPTLALLPALPFLRAVDFAQTDLRRLLGGGVRPPAAASEPAEAAAGPQAEESDGGEEDESDKEGGEEEERRGVGGVGGAGGAGGAGGEPLAGSASPHPAGGRLAARSDELPRKELPCRGGLRRRRPSASEVAAQREVPIAAREREQQRERERGRGRDGDCQPRPRRRPAPFSPR